MSLAQQALDLSAAVQIRLTQGGGIPTAQIISDLAVGIQLLAQNALSATPSMESLDPGANDVPVTLPAVDEPPG